MIEPATGQIESAAELVQRELTIKTKNDYKCRTIAPDGEKAAKMGIDIGTAFQYF